MQNTVEKRQEALENFESEIRHQITADITAANKDELLGLQQEFESKRQELSDKNEEIEQIEKQLKEEYEPVFGKDLCTSSYVGYGGVGETTEWNRKTPRGQFSFTYAFGILPNPGTELSYTQVDDTYYWVDDVNSRYYNQFVTTKTTPKAWNFPADAFLFRKTR